ncbi:Set1 complex component spp1 [Pleurostoma richardsiae]|uniref:Set1 complex component spp1 n=1 Tax=Pleurostoma richardsiae TaxID=41990 RepID=A0AA38S9J7_9PEZI|nr:Set1 complex component spp1 [Pleurostoma richardsiae]
MDPYSNAYFTVGPMADSKEGNGNSNTGEAPKAANGAGLDGEGQHKSKVKMEVDDPDQGVPEPQNGSSALPASLPDGSYPGSSVLNERFNKMFDEDVTMMDIDKPEPSVSSKSKKKGTAATVKKRKVATKKAGKTKKAGTDKAASASRASAESEASGSSAGSDEESDHGPYCICRGPDDHRWMIQCEVCEDWFHGECVNIDKAIGESLIQRYVCPNCYDGKWNVTRYKKTCSLEGCNNVARIYGKKGGDEAGSIFCSDKHRDEWWERLITTLPPRTRVKDNGDQLTREDFMGLLNASAVDKGGAGGEVTWRFGDIPFGVPSDFWTGSNASAALTEEESAFLSASAADRYQLAEEIVLTKKMQQLLDMANERRKAAVAAKRLEPDACGYDFRLDVVGAQAQFAAFVKSPRGEAIFKANRLDAPSEQQQRQAPPPGAAGNGAVAAAEEPGGSNWCERRRCKTHAQWYALFTKSNRQQIKELAAQAKDKLDAETRVRDAAAVRHLRKKRERNWVEVIESDGEESG